MKKLTFKICALALLLTLLTAFASCSVQSMPEYLGELDHAGEDEFVLINEGSGDYIGYNYWDGFVYEGFKVDLEDIVSGNVLDIFCVYNGRYYFLYQTATAGASTLKIWNIASVDERGENFEIHGEYALNSDSSASYDDLMAPTREYMIGGAFYDGVIYLIGSDGKIAYNVKTGMATSFEALPQKYVITYRLLAPGTIDLSTDIVLYNAINDEYRELDYSALENNCEVIKKLDKLTGLGGQLVGSIIKSSITRKDYSIIDGELYLSYTVPEYEKGEITQYTVLFRYDYDTDALVYVCYMPTFDEIDIPMFIKNYK